MKKMLKFIMKKMKLRVLCVALLTATVLHVCSMKSEGYIRKRAVTISAGRSLCSGEQVRAPSGVDYILTAAHCKEIAINDVMTIIDADGNVLSRKVIAEDPKSDLLLIEGLPNLRGLDIAHSVYAAEHVRTFTHGARMATYKTEGELIQTKQVQIMLGLLGSPEAEKACASQPKYKVVHAEPPFDMIAACVLSVDEAVSTAKIVPGSSGGMVVDDAGDLVGVASATDENFNYFVMLSDIQRFMSGY